MRRVAIVVTTALVALMSCFIKPDRPGDGLQSDGGNGDGMGTNDARPSDGSLQVDAAANCTTITFDVQAADCGTWATTFAQGGTAAVSSSALRLTLGSGSASGEVNCTSSDRRALDTATIEITAPIATNTLEQTWFRIETVSGSRWGAELGPTGTGSSTITVNCDGGILPARTWDPATEKFVRLERAGSDVLDVKLGPALGGPWTLLGSCPNAILDEVAIEVGAGRGSGGSMTTAIFATLQLCP